MAKPTQTIAAAEEKHPLNWGAIILWPVALLLVYVLSFGPVMKMYHNRKPHGSDTLLALYRPIVWAYEHTLLHKPLGMYFHLWDPDEFDRQGEFILDIRPFGSWRNAFAGSC